MGKITIYYCGGAQNFTYSSVLVGDHFKKDTQKWSDELLLSVELYFFRPGLFSIYFFFLLHKAFLDEQRAR